MKLHYCFLERFNNYFNRKIIKYESLNDYLDHSKDSFIPLNKEGNMASFDFNPNDNVMTEIIANDVPFDADYFLLLDDNSNIVQRWFILEQKRNREGQWLYTLKRDVICDNFNNLLNAPIFVQKGMLSENDPFIFNSEGMEFNQIKKQETLLPDKSKSAWVVCYLAKNLVASDIALETPSTEITPDYVTLFQIATELGISESDLASALNINPGDDNKLILTKEVKAVYSYMTGGMPGYTYNASFNMNTVFYEFYGETKTSAMSPVHPYLFYGDRMSEFEAQIRNNSTYILSGITTFLGRNYYINYTLSAEVLSRYNGKIILYAGNYYTLSVSYSGDQHNSKVFKPIDDTLWNTICENSGGFISPLKENAELELDFTETNAVLTLSSYTPAVIKYEMNISSSRKVCQDQEFDIIAMPASSISIHDPNVDFDTLDGISQKMAIALAKKEGTNIYDIQLLPYCPRPDMIEDNKKINIKDFTEHTDYDYIQYVVGGITYNVGLVVYLESASFKNKIDLNLFITESKKIDSQCNFYRLVSPNYQGNFEFNVAKNGGTVEYFNCYCTYKPYTPFIKVTPKLNDLYGKDYNDNRGLLCGGDFSLTRISSAWQQYQLENKNYQNIFNREIQNMSFMQSIEMRNQRISGAVGIVSDVAKGAGAGAFVGGAGGALVGGIFGGATSAIGYVVDTDTLAKTQRETKQLAIDKFSYQLGNIKALPYTLTKVGTFDISSKIFPFLEYYTCTEEEKTALINKIKYESMTVMRIGKLSEFINFNNELNYFKGELIRNDEIADDPHTLNAIYEEFLKGVYI